jgi:beta-glucosidase
VQVYISQRHPTLPRPPKELKGFAKVFIRRGATRTVWIPLNSSSFRYYDPKQNKWVIENDVFDVLVGSSSRDIRLKGEVSP